LPGGARDSHETPEEAAKREAHEEAGLAGDLLSVRATVVTADVNGSYGTRWTYTTVLADADELLQTVPNMESAELRWVIEDEVARLPLHPGFADSWQRLRTALEIVPWSPGGQPRGNLARTVEIEDGGLVLRIVGLSDQTRPD
jgi:8-oxo-dGTP diphosphatase